MSQSDLLSLVRESGQFESDEEADRAVRATLDALADCLSPGERRDIAEPLPERYADCLDTAEAGRTSPPDIDAFFDRVRTEADGRTVEPKVRVVLAALGEVVGEAELADARAQLPPEYGRLFGPATVEPGTPTSPTRGPGRTSGPWPTRSSKRSQNTNASGPRHSSPTSMHRS